MDEQDQILQEEETTDSQPQAKPKSQLQMVKEYYYDKVPLTLKQLDIIVWCCYAAIAVLVVCIALDAMGIIG